MYRFEVVIMLVLLLLCSVVSDQAILVLVVGVTAWVLFKCGIGFAVMLENEAVVKFPL